MTFVIWNGLFPGFVTAGYIAELLNSFIHVFMYSYFALAAIGISVPWRKYITRSQITQFIIILIHMIPWPYFKYVQGYNCSGTFQGWLWLQLPVFVILCLFLNFYIKQFHKKTTKSKKEEKKKIKNLYFIYYN